jgi:hypothetical protein
MYFDEAGKLRSMLTEWTDLKNSDPFIEASKGRSWFRLDDLVNLSMLLETLRNSQSDSQGDVK